jgi:hypothetical protein
MYMQIWNRYQGVATVAAAQERSTHSKHRNKDIYGVYTPAAAQEGKEA